MKKPRWATKKQLRWKVVTANERSIIPIKGRIADCYGADVGCILRYPSHKIITSPNGVCKIKTHSCCRGIVAWKQRAIAQGFIDSCPSKNNYKIIAIYSSNWIEVEGLSRTNRVYVE